MKGKLIFELILKLFKIIASIPKIMFKHKNTHPYDRDAEISDNLEWALCTQMILNTMACY